MCVKTSKKKTCNLSCIIAAEQVEKRCCAFYHPRSNLLTTSFVARQVWCGQMRQLYANNGNESTWRLVEDGMNTGLTNTHTARGLSVLYHVFALKQCILSTLRHKSYLTLPYMLYRFEIQSVSELSRTALLGCRLAASCLREAARWQLLWIANLVVWVQQNTVLICTFYTLSGSSWHSHQTFCLSIPQAGRAKDTKVKRKIKREIGTRKSRTKSVVSSTLTK